MRHFYIENDRGERYSLNSEDGIFFDNPSGLGQTMSPSSADIHKGFFKDITGDIEPQAAITGDLVFTRDAYNKYNQFVNWINRATALYFVYAPKDTEYRRKVSFDFIQKTQLDPVRWLRCPVSFRCLTPFYKSQATTLSMEDSSYAMRYTFVYDENLRYSASSIAGMSCEIQGQGHIPSAISFRCTGYLANPELTLTGQDSGTVYGKLKLNRTTAASQVLSFCSRYGETEVAVDGADALEYVDLSYDPWLRVPPSEKCSLVLSSDDDMNVTVELLMYDYYRTV